MRTLEEVEKDLDKVKAEFDKLLSEKYKIECRKAKYFRRDVTLILYTKKHAMSDSAVESFVEFLGNYNYFDGVKLEHGSFSLPVSEEEYNEAVK